MNYNKLQFNEVDAFIILSEHNRYYLSGFHSSFGIMVVMKDKAVYMTDRRYELACLSHFASTPVEVKIISGEQEGYEIVTKLIAENDVKNVGFEDNMSVRDFYSLKTAIPSATLIPKGAYIEQVRMIKTDEEVGKIKTAMDLSCKAFNDFLGAIKPGLTEKQLCAELNYRLFYYGADTLAFDTIVASGPNGSKPHAVPSDRVVQKGDMITFDFGARLDGYCADITRTVALGKIDEEQKRVYNMVLNAQKIGLNAIKVGLTGREVDGVVREYFVANGVGDEFCHSLGHGVGVEIHELPRLSTKSDIVLAPNMIATCEPGLYFLEKYGVRIEDTVCVKENGILNLCSLEKELITL